MNISNKLRELAANAELARFSDNEHDAKRPAIKVSDIEALAQELEGMVVVDKTAFELAVCDLLLVLQETQE